MIVITNAVLDFLNETKGLKAPSNREIAKRTGLHIKTVERHQKELTFEPLKCPQRNLTPLVINNHYKLALKNPSALKLWYQIMEGWVEKSEVETSGKIIVRLPDSLEIESEE